MHIRIVAFLFVTSLSAFAQGSQTGTITGRVVNESGQPLPNARVSVLAVGPLQQNEGTLTDREGNFQVAGLQPRSYRVFASLSTYTPLASDLDAWLRNYRIGESVRLVMTKGGVITGTVTSQTGEPIVRVRVYARMIRNENSRLSFPFPTSPLERTTDDRGVYRIYGVPAGTYLVWAGGSEVNNGFDAFESDVPTYSPSSTRDTAEEISVRAGEEQTNVDIRYRGEPGHVISGSVRASESGGTTTEYGINLTVVGSKVDWAMMTGQERNSKGFVFRGVDDGDYLVTALSAAENQVTGIVSKRIKVRGADVTGIELVTQPLASVTGRVVLEESKATDCPGKQRLVFAETFVSASSDETQSADLHPQLRWLLGGAPVNPDAQGNVSFKYLMPGRYFFVPQFAGKYWYLQSVTLTPAASTKTAPVDAARNWTTLKSGDRVSGLTITLAQGAASLQGQLVLKEGEAQPEGTFVYLVPAEREKASDVLRFFAAGVNAEGKIAVNNVPPGRYWVLVKSDTATTSVTKLRWPDQAGFRAKLRQEAEAANKEIEFTPCQNVNGFPVPLKAPGQ
jgi:hypothetical protein